MITPRHDEARKVAAVVRHQLKAEGAIGRENYPVTVLRRMDLGPEARIDQGVCITSHASQCRTVD